LISKQIQADEACHKILRSANLLLGYVEQENTSVNMCEKQDDSFAKDETENIEHLDHLSKDISEKLHQQTESNYER